MTTKFFNFQIDSECGEIKVGPARIHWYNQGPEEDDYAFCILAWGDYNLELGCADQDRPGIYLTRYTYEYDVERLRTFLTL